MNHQMNIDEAIAIAKEYHLELENKLKTLSNDIRTISES